MHLCDGAVIFVWLLLYLMSKPDINGEPKSLFLKLEKVVVQKFCNRNVLQYLMNQLKYRMSAKVTIPQFSLMISNHTLLFDSILHQPLDLFLD